MTYYILLLLVLTVIIWLLARYRLAKACPVCGAALITWIMGLVALYQGAEWGNPTLVAILMGATLGAVGEKYGSQLGFLWKTLWVILGFSAIYLLVQRNIWAGLILVAVIGAITWWVSAKQIAKSPMHKDLFDDCC